MHFAYLVKGIEQMINTGKPAWPVERTLLSTGILNAYFRSKSAGDRELETPWLDVHYQSDWNWHQPPPPPPGRPIAGTITADSQIHRQAFAQAADGHQ